MHTAEALCMDLSHLWAAELSHICVCNKAAQIIQGLKKK